MTQYADPNGTAQVNTLQQDGFAAGQLQGVTVSDNGRIVGTYSNGRTLDLAEITLANFSGSNNLKMIDGGEVDDKIVAVPVSKVDPTYDEIKTVDDLPAIERARIEQFFAVYKKLPDGRKVVEMKGYEGVNAAVDMLSTGLEKFKTTEVSTSAQ